MKYFFFFFHLDESNQGEKSTIKKQFSPHFLPIQMDPKFELTIWGASELSWGI